MRNKIIGTFGMALLASTLQVSAQTFPNRPIRIVVPGTAGSANDFTARAIAQRLTDTWGQQMVIDNRAGAGGIIAHEIAAKATPDGYTLIFSTSAGIDTQPAAVENALRSGARFRAGVAGFDQSADAVCSSRCGGKKCR